MQRAEQLRPLSRQHNLGLNLGLKASLCPDEANASEVHSLWQQLVAYIDDEITTHFSVEEHYLVQPLLSEHGDNSQIQALSQQLVEQHQQLYQLINNNTPHASDLRKLGQALYDHIRFEERNVFPLAQQLLTTEQLDTIFEHASQDVK